MVEINKFSQFVSVVRKMNSFTFSDIKKYLLEKYKDHELITINHRLMYYFELLIMADFIDSPDVDTFVLKKEIPTDLTIIECQRLSK